MAIQQKKLEITIITRADEPLYIDAHTRGLIEAAVDQAVRTHVDLRYWPESSYITEHHAYLGTSVEEAK